MPRKTEASYVEANCSHDSRRGCDPRDRDRCDRAFPACRRAGDDHVQFAPPPPPYEVVPAPRPGYVWAPGAYRLVNDRYVWNPGTWQQARAGYRYVPDRWERYNDNGREQWRYQASRWDKDGDGIPNRNDHARQSPRSGLGRQGSRRHSERCRSDQQQPPPLGRGSGRRGCGALRRPAFFTIVHGNKGETPCRSAQTALVCPSLSRRLSRTTGRSTCHAWWRTGRQSLADGCGSLTVFGTTGRAPRSVSTNATARWGRWSVRVSIRRRNW